MFYSGVAYGGGTLCGSGGGARTRNVLLLMYEKKRFKPFIVLFPFFSEKNVSLATLAESHRGRSGADRAAAERLP